MTESELFGSPEQERELREKLAGIGVHLLTIPAPVGEELHRLQGWRDGIEEHGQELWGIYHWIVKGQGGRGHGIYRLRDWLEHYHVPDNTPEATRGEHPTWPV